ncbi:hypothetical protein [Thermococcus sp.]
MSPFISWALFTYLSAGEKKKPEKGLRELEQSSDFSPPSLAPQDGRGQIY